MHQLVGEDRLDLLQCLACYDALRKHDRRPQQSEHGRADWLCRHNDADSPPQPQSLAEASRQQLNLGIGRDR